MTKIDITPASDGVKIQLSGLGAAKAAYLDTFNSCAEGHCACSSDEYQKVESMQVTSEGDAITVEVHAKAGQTIDPACISDCLDTAQANTEPSGGCC